MIYDELLLIYKPAPPPAPQSLDKITVIIETYECIETRPSPAYAPVISHLLHVRVCKSTSTSIKRDCRAQITEIKTTF